MLVVYGVGKAKYSNSIFVYNYLTFGLGLSTGHRAPRLSTLGTTSRRLPIASSRHWRPEGNFSEISRRTSTASVRDARQAFWLCVWWLQGGGRCRERRQTMKKLVKAGGERWCTVSAHAVVVVLRLSFYLLFFLTRL